MEVHHDRSVERALPGSDGGDVTVSGGVWAHLRDDLPAGLRRHVVAVFRSAFVALVSSGPSVMPLPSAAAMAARGPRGLAGALRSGLGSRFWRLAPRCWTGSR